MNENNENKYALLDLSIQQLESMLKCFNWLPQDCNIESISVPDDTRSIVLRLTSKTRFYKVASNETIPSVAVTISLG